MNSSKRARRKRNKEAALRRATKLLLLDTHGYKCWDCGVDTNLLHLHHKEHLSQLGKTSDENCELLCRKCHSAKHGIREV